MALPQRIIIERGALSKLPELILQLGLQFPIALISGPHTSSFAAQLLAGCDPSQIRLLVFQGQPAQIIEQAAASILEISPKCVVGLGGGRIIDLAKLLGTRLKLPVIAAPTNASHDGIASPRANPVRGQPSIPVDPPIAVVADLEIIAAAPSSYSISGAGDLIANYTACLDWKLAHQEKGEQLNPEAYRLSMSCALRIIQLAESGIQDRYQFLKELVSKLVDSGIAMCLVNSSRPASGSEHLFSHALDRLAPNPGLHGIQCGLGSIMMSYLHGEDWERIKDCLVKLGAPVNAKCLGISSKSILAALTIAHTVNPERYTILRNGLSRSQAQQLAKATGVI